jgi:uncharacterized protein (TIGR03067 family)
MRSQVAALVGFCLVVGGVAGQAGKGDKQLEGTWLLVSVEKGGKKQDKSGDNFTVAFSGGKLHLKKKDETKDGTYTIDPSKKPKHIDMSVDGENVLGIYEVKDGTLRICGAGQGEPRPTEFKAPEGARVMILTFSREKKEKK